MHLGDKLKLYRKSRDLDQFQMAEILKVSHRKYQEIEKTGIVLKAADQQNIREVLEGGAQNITHARAAKSEEADPLLIIASLTESNRMLAEANLLLAKKINSDTPAVASVSSTEKEIVSSNPVEEMQPGTQGKRSLMKPDRKKGSVADLNK